jgi:ribosomal protein S18 acetylase RimI-like enzyme
MTTEKIHIRQYRSHDHDSVWKLHNLALDKADAHSGNGPWDNDLHAIEEVYLRDGGEFLVGVLHGQIVAMGALKRVSDTTAEIKRMRVHPNHLRKGFGQAVLSALEEKARYLGYTKLILDTTALQTAAQKFYLKNGYEEIKRGKLGRFDLIYYKKDLGK